MFCFVFRFVSFLFVSFSFSLLWLSRIWNKNRILKLNQNNNIINKYSENEIVNNFLTIWFNIFHLNRIQVIMKILLCIFIQHMESAMILIQLLYSVFCSVIIIQKSTQYFFLNGDEVICPPCSCDANKLLQFFFLKTRFQFFSMCLFFNYDKPAH